MTMPGVPYLMESADEGARLEAKTDVLLAERLLTLTGLPASGTALDAGCGTGAVARLMARRMVQGGHVVAGDRSVARLQEGEDRARTDVLPNLSFLEIDLENAPPGGGPYDYVWCRFVFEYLSDPDRALAHLVQATRIGGRVVVADLDGNAVFHHPSPPLVSHGLERILAALEGRFDPYAGRKLFHRFRKAGLADVKVHLEPYHVHAGAPGAVAMANWEQKVRTIRPAGVAALGEAAYDGWARAFLEMLRDEDAFTYSMLVVVHGTRTR
jgi:SAM-dependent methyltransferase